MKTRYYNKAAALAVLGVAVALMIVLWPSLGRGAEPQEPQDTQQPQDTQEPLDAQPPQSMPEPQDAQPQDPWAKFEIILNRNIFSRQRGPIRRTEDMPERRQVVIPNPESYFVLKGIVQEDGNFLAFMEDTRSNSVLRLRQGDAVAGGTISSLTLDGIEFQMDDRTIAVGLGRNLEGGLGSGAVTVDQLMEWSDTASSASQPSAAASDPNATGDDTDVLKQLMERRKQQLGQ